MFLTSWNLSRLAILLPLVFLTASFGQSSTNSTPNETQANQAGQTLSTVTIEMDENKIDLLRRTGFLRLAIPPAYRGKVDGVRLKREVSFKSDDFQLVNVVDKLNDTITVTVNDTALERLDFQPVIAKVYYPAFSSVVLVYDRRQPGGPIGLTERENKPTAADSSRFFARVGDKRGLFGWMTGLAKIKLTSDFGEVFLNSTDIAGIKFNANKSGSVSIRLNSGASISGYVDFDEINMKCSWGTQKLALAELDSIVADRKFRFAQDPYHPGRWSFVSDLATPPALPAIDGSTVPGFTTPLPVRSLPYNP